MQLARPAQPQESFSTHFLIVKISSFVVFLSWFTTESPQWLIIPKSPSSKSNCHWIPKWNTPLLKLFLVNIFQTKIVCCLIECFYGNVVSPIVLHIDKQCIQYLNILLSPNNIFPIRNSLFFFHQDFYQNINDAWYHGVHEEWKF